MRDLEQEIVTRRLELARLEREKQIEDSMPPQHRVAELIHEFTCRSNHTDGCGWFYTTWEKPCETRKRHLDAALRVLAIEPDISRLRAIVRAFKC